MAKVWSFNTTVRNPERVQNFLKTLKELEGRTFDSICQKDFFALQIKKRLYNPENSTLLEKDLIDEVNRETAEEIPDEIVSRIIKKYKEPDLRGRATAGILNRFGLCIAYETKGPIKITELGNRWLSGKIEDQELFFKFLLKWQYPNPIEGNKSFNIKPFIGTLKLIRKVNELWAIKGNDPVGISKTEFLLFAPSLTDYKNIDDYSQKIIEHRLELKKRHTVERKKYENDFFWKRIEQISEGVKSELLAKNLKDYTNSALKYFRMSDFIYLRGKGYYIDISSTHKIEVDRLLEKDDARSIDFDNFEEYLSFLIDTSLPKLPWENEKDLELIKKLLIKISSSLARSLDKQTLLKEVLDSLPSLSLNSQISKLREFKNNLEIIQLRDLKYNYSELDKFINFILNAISSRPDTVTARPSLDLEWFVALSLMVLNDAEAIIPSVNLGDDGIPTGFRSNITDVECLYEDFGIALEVTSLRGRDQWYAEGQPVMRHLRDFEDKYSHYEDIYGVFIAPYMHRDTLNTFWESIKGVGYEGKKQKIVPLRVDQFIKILTTVCAKLKQGAKTNHKQYNQLIKSLYEKSSSSSDPNNWISNFDQVIEDWSLKL